MKKSRYESRRRRDKSSKKKKSGNRILITEVSEGKENPKSQSLQGVSFCVITEMHEYRIGSAKMLMVLELLDSNL